MLDDLLRAASLGLFLFCALAFSILTVSYWSERRNRRLQNPPRRSAVFPLFTLVCAAAFSINLLFQIVPVAPGGWSATLLLLRDLAIGLLPPLMVSLVYEQEADCLLGRRVWRNTVAIFYAASAACALLRSLDESGFVAVAGTEVLARTPAVGLLVAAAAGLGIQAWSRRIVAGAERAHRNWIRGLFCVMAICAGMNLARPVSAASVLPDYILLMFFCASLYYRERLAFFDVLVKRGAFFASGLTILTVGFVVGSRHVPADASAGLVALLVAPFWLMSPWIYSRLERTIDRLWLGRRFSTVEAERRFIGEIQGAVTEDELRSRAADVLQEIFQASPDVQFTSMPSTVESLKNGMGAPIDVNGVVCGFIAISPRKDSIPFLSDDHRLLQSLARTLCVMLENLRFRVERQCHNEREQELRWLASRAELRALRAQINPHFLFNALNAIADLVHSQPEAADETIEQLAQVFRYTLRKSENEWVPLAEEVEFIAAYLRVEQARFNEKLEVSFELDPATSLVAIPAMSVQPLIENAIKHGVCMIEGRGRVTLRALLRAGPSGPALLIEVEDNGPGFPEDMSLENAGTGHGLRNITDRLRGYYGESARLQWERTRGTTRVMLNLPMTSAPTAIGPSAGGARYARSDR